MTAPPSFLGVPRSRLGEPVRAAQRHGEQQLRQTATSARRWSGLLSLLPTAVFLAVDSHAGLVPAMVAASAVSCAVVLLRRRRGAGIGVLLPASLAYTVAKVVAGVVTGSQFVYFGTGLVLNVLVVLTIAATAFTARPAAATLLPTVVRYRHVRSSDPLYRRVTAQITLVWALAELTVTAWEAHHLTVTTASEFVLTRTVLGWPAMAAVIFLLIAYTRLRLDPHEHHLARHQVLR